MPFLLQAPTSDTASAATVPGKSVGLLPKSKSSTAVSVVRQMSCLTIVDAASRTIAYESPTCGLLAADSPVVTQTEVPSVAGVLQTLPPMLPAGMSK